MQIVVLPRLITSNPGHCISFFYRTVDIRSLLFVMAIAKGNFHKRVAKVLFCDSGEISISAVIAPSSVWRALRYKLCNSTAKHVFSKIC